MVCFALFACFGGLVLTFATFCIGLKVIIGNEDPSDLICKSVEPGSVYEEFLNSLCELGFVTLYLGGHHTTIPTTLIALIYMIFNGLLCYGLIKKKPKFIYKWQLGNFLSTFALLFIAVYVSYFLFLTFPADC